jgi:hypothetical protein
MLPFGRIQNPEITISYSKPPLLKRVLLPIDEKKIPHNL